MQKILLTGGAGYIGSHTCVALVEAGFEPVILDNFANSHPAVLQRLQTITGRAIVCERGDVLDTPWVTEVLRRHRPAGVVHFAGDKAVGRCAHLNVFGNDYPTPDGTGVRDYIHVQDLAAGHLAALQALQGRGESFTVNLGTGRGHSVLELVHAFEQASGRAVPCQFAPRRAGDVAQYWADASLARDLLGWQARYTLEEMCADAWRWQSANPDGYR